MDIGVDLGLRRTLTWIAGVVAAATAVAIPALYLYTAHSYESDRIQRNVDELARSVSEFVFTYPESWIFNEHLQQKMLLDGRAHGRLGVHRLIDRDGRLIAETGMRPAAPTVRRVSDISDGFDVVGHVEIVESVRHIWMRTGIAAIVGAVLALVMFAAVRVIPLRALVRVVGRLHVSQTQLVATQDELLRKTRLATLGQITATVSHELRNPLGTIRASIYSISMKMRDKNLGVDRALARVERNITRCDDIIEDLLEFSRVRELAHEATAFDGWLDGVLDDQRIPDGVTLRRDLGAGVEVDIDPDRLRRVVINLIDNAFQAVIDGAADGGRERAVAIETRALDGNVELAVADTGSGIPADLLPKVFEPLYSTKSFGTGLGLPTVKQIVEQHGGGIEISSEEGRGTRVVLWLPTEASGQQQVVEA